MKGLLASLLVLALFAQVVLAEKLPCFGKRDVAAKEAQTPGTIHPPLEIDWEVSAKPPKYLLCSKDRLMSVAGDEISIFAISTLTPIKTIQTKHKTKPFIVGNLMIVATEKVLTAYDIDIGEIKWSIEKDYIDFALAFHDKILLTAGNTISVYTTEGALDKTFEVDDKIESHPEVVGDSVTFPCIDSKIRVFFDNGFSQQNAFTKPGAVINSVHLRDNLLYVILSKGSGIAFDINTGDSQWKTSEPTGSNIQVLSDGMHLITFGTTSGIVCRRITDGSFVWRYAKVDVSSMSCSGRLLYVMTTDGNLLALQMSNGADSGNTNLGVKPSGFLTVYEGKLFAGIDAKIVRLSTSKYRAFLGFNGSFDLDVVYTNQVTKKTVSVVNLLGKKQSVKMFVAQIPYLTINPQGFMLEPGQEMQVELTINSTGILFEDFKGYVVADSPYYRYFLGVSALITQLPGDCNLDCIVDAEDLIELGLAYGSKPHNKEYKKECDLDRNGIIDINDMFIVSRNLGRKCFK